ncbi:DUF1236 domain-containing protein [Histidinibacterium aquaticum]|uniref:SH3 domain-containing protein n=1 Tax=Histidinibacterium aquaticum TaxID=2613962 RepID=A0A5J5GJG5_9RHOB|nr:DUF1236 domain-containing protein [Histidinibacterium aquaticum]KAA9008257.1 SH3 domain-containing protein [Histidinibacterium aquaticum]
MKPTMILGASAIALTAAAPAFAQSMEASAVTDLNLRAEASNSSEVLTVIPAETAVTVAGCDDTTGWCEVTYDGTTGYSYGSYLTENMAEEPSETVVLVQPQTVETTTVTTEGTDTEQRVGAGAGAAAGALTAYALGGPVGGIIASSIFGAAAGAEATDQVERQVTYVRENPVEAVTLDGEVVVGAQVPGAVTTYDLPADGYEYLNVNGLPVIIDAESGTILRIVR